MKYRVKQIYELISKVCMTDRTRYRFLAVFLGCVHLFLALAGVLLMCLPLVVANVVVAAVDFISV